MNLTNDAVKRAVLKYLHDPKAAEARLVEAKKLAKKHADGNAALKELAKNLAAVTKTVTPGNNSRTDTALKGLASHLPTVQQWAGSASSILKNAQEDAAIYEAVKKALKTGTILWVKNKPVRVHIAAGMTVAMLLWDVVANQLGVKPAGAGNERRFARVDKDKLTAGAFSNSAVYTDQTSSRSLNVGLEWVVSNHWIGKK